MVYTINETDTGLEVVDENGHELTMIEIEALTKRMIELANPKPVARLLFNEQGAGQLVLFDGKKKRKPVEKTEDEKRIGKRTQEIMGLYRKLAGLTRQQLALPMDQLMALIPTLPSVQLTANGKEGVYANKLAKDERQITDRQIVACFKWLSTSKDRNLKWHFDSKIPSLSFVLEKMSLYLSLIPESAKSVTANDSRNAAYAAIEGEI